MRCGVQWLFLLAALVTLTQGQPSDASDGGDGPDGGDGADGGDGSGGGDCPEAAEGGDCPDEAPTVGKDYFSPFWSIMAIITLCFGYCGTGGAWCRTEADSRFLERLRFGPRWLASPVGPCRWGEACTRTSHYSFLIGLMLAVILFLVFINVYQDELVGRMEFDSFLTYLGLFLLLPAGLSCMSYALLSRCFIQRQHQKNTVALEQNSLVDPRALGRYLFDADVRILRFEYLQELKAEGKSLPRRQEAPASAFRTPKEVLAWTEEMRKNPDSEERVISVSHSWETREHPDFWDFQLHHIVDSLEEAWEEGLIFGVFYDFTCLYQFPRTNRENGFFKKSMAGMQIIYSHDWTSTFCIGKLTPEANKTKDRKVRTFFVPEGCVTDVPIEKLIQNSVPYQMRGWCLAEIQWSSLRSFKLLKLVIMDGQDLWTSQAPLTPDFFRKMLSRSEVHFTHRVDLEPLIKAQKAAFEAKAKQCKILKFENLPVEQVDTLSDALPHYSKVTTLHLWDCDVTVGNFPTNESLDSYAKAKRKSFVSFDSFLEQARYLSFESFAKRLNFNENLRNVFLQKCGMKDEEVVLLAEALSMGSWKHLDLEENCIGDRGAQALALSFRHSKVEHLSLRKNQIGAQGAMELLIFWGEKACEAQNFDLSPDAVMDAAKAAWHGDANELVLRLPNMVPELLTANSGVGQAARGISKGISRGIQGIKDEARVVNYTLDISNNDVASSQLAWISLLKAMRLGPVKEKPSHVSLPVAPPDPPGTLREAGDAVEGVPTTMPEVEAV